METRRLPGLEQPSSRVALGTMTFGGQVDAEEAASMIDVSLGMGVTMFDTANSYTGGQSEILLGRALGSRRDQVLLASKVRQRYGEGPDEVGLEPLALKKSVEASLERLGTDWLDVLYFHHPHWGVPLEESLGAAHELVTAGKVRAVALSNYPAWEMARGGEVASGMGLPVPRIHQTMYNLLARALEEEYAAFSEHAGIVNVVYNPLAGGLLTGRYIDSTVIPDAGRFTRSVYRDRYWHDAFFAAVTRLDAIASGAGLTTVELAISWLWSRPLADIVLLGASSLHQLEANLAAAALPPPSDDVLEACDEVWGDIRGPAPRYWR